jgi:TonB family protein
VREPLPQYPIVAVKARISGQAIVDLFVSEAGDVVSAQVVKPLPFGLSEAALEAARAWKFRPSPAPFHVQLDFHFQTVAGLTLRPVSPVFQCPTGGERDGLRELEDLISLAKTFQPHPKRSDLLANEIGSICD